MKNVFLIAAVVVTALSLVCSPSSAQPWSVPATNAVPQVRPPAADWVAAPVPATPIPPPHQPAPAAQSVLSPIPLPAGILAFDAEQKEYVAKAGEQNAAFDFSVTNISSAEVTVTFVQTSCGCTTAKITLPMKIAAGATAEIPINMSLMGKSGVVIKTVTVHTDKGQKVLMVKTTIEPPAADPAGMAMARERNQQIAQADRQNVFKGDCARCHVEPVIGKMGKELYTTACGICHEAEHRATMVADLRNLKTPPNAEYWKFFIVNGKPATLMPAFAQAQGGPLSDLQIASLVDYLVKDFPTTTKTNAPAHASLH